MCLGDIADVPVLSGWDQKEGLKPLHHIFNDLDRIEKDWTNIAPQYILKLSPGTI